MPPLGLHTVIAKEVGDRLRHRVLDAERGNLYLGATAPDIRVITRWERGRTHFFDLHNFDEQSGVAGLFSAYPRLGQPGSLGPGTAGVGGGGGGPPRGGEVGAPPPDWERFRFIASRHLREAGIETPEQFEEFVRSLPDLVDETLRYLTEGRGREVMGSARRGSVTAVKEYLECA